MAPKKRKRTRPTDLSDDQAAELLSMHVPVASTPSSLWSYPTDPDKSKPGLNWNATNKARAFLTDVLDFTKGRVVRQNKFSKQVHTFLKGQQLPFSVPDAERCVYNIRRMLSGLLDAKRSVRSPPERFQHLQVLIDKMYLSDDEDDDCVDDDDDEVPPEQIVVFNTGASSSTAVQPKPTRCLQVVISSASEPTAIANDHDEDDIDIDALHDRLFDTGASSSTAAPVGNDEMELLTSGCQRGPLPAEYKDTFKRPASGSKGPAKKRPAAAPAAAAAPEVPMAKVRY